MKAIAIKTSPHFKGMFEIGDEVEVIPILYEEDTLLVWGTVSVESPGKEPYKIRYDGSVPNLKPNETYSILSAPVIAPKGSFKDLHFKLPDGRVFNTDVITRATGKHFSDYFKKIT